MVKRCQSIIHLLGLIWYDYKFTFCDLWAKTYIVANRFLTCFTEHIHFDAFQKIVSLFLANFNNVQFYKIVNFKCIYQYNNKWSRAALLYSIFHRIGFAREMKILCSCCNLSIWYGLNQFHAIAYMCIRLCVCVVCTCSRFCRKP